MLVSIMKLAWDVSPLQVVRLPIVLQYDHCKWHELMLTSLLVCGCLQNESTAKSTSGNGYSRLFCSHLLSTIILHILLHYMHAMFKVKHNWRYCFWSTTCIYSRES